MSRASKNTLAQRLRDLAGSGTLSDAVCALLLEAAKTLETNVIAAPPTPTKVVARSGLKYGEEIVWPKGVEARYGISLPTRWRWEHTGRLPPRDVNIGAGKSGWRKSTLDKWESRQ